MSASHSPEPLYRRALKLLFLQHSYGGVVSLPLIMLAGVAPATALVLSYGVSAFVVARRHPVSFPPRPRRSEGLALVGLATLLFWAALPLVMHLFDADALPNVARSHKALSLFLRVACGYPALTLVGLAVGGGGMRKDDAPPDPDTDAPPV